MSYVSSLVTFVTSNLEFNDLRIDLLLQNAENRISPFNQ